MHECIKVSVSSCFPENDRGEAIFGFLKIWAGDVDGRETQDGETCGGVGNGQEPEG